ncbi:Uncharacterised protein [Bordetella pertussis]|nr:Uncharacterised protein [Bordetella pertussis]CPN55911.1 Uncharacterised protein [Bordetella pertussis]
MSPCVPKYATPSSPPKNSAAPHSISSYRAEVDKATSSGSR